MVSLTEDQEMDKKCICILRKKRNKEKQQEKSYVKCTNPDAITQYKTARAKLRKLMYMVIIKLQNNSTINLKRLPLDSTKRLFTFLYIQ